MGSRYAPVPGSPNIPNFAPLPAELHTQLAEHMVPLGAICNFSYLLIYLLTYLQTLVQN